MTSKIDNTRINANFPRAGQNNDSRGFRDNFANIKVALGNARNEISELHLKGIFKSGIADTPGLNNDMAWESISRVQLTSSSDTFFNVGEVSGATDIDYTNGNIQQLTLVNNIELGLINFPPPGQWGSLVLWFSVANKNFKVLLPQSVVFGLDRNTQIVNRQITFPEAGDYLIQLASADNGNSFWVIDFANLGGSGGGAGNLGATGATGIAGPTGATGVPGSFGGITLAYRFRTTTGFADPGSGFLAFNANNLTQATRMYIDKQDADGVSVTSFLRTIDDSTNPIKGHFKISNRLNFNDFAIFTFDGLIEEPGFFQINSTWVNGAVQFDNIENILITFARNGDMGPIGATGATGVQGIPGTAVFMGATGATGPLGPNGPLGPPGPLGPQGVPGPVGPIGASGATGIQGASGATGPQGIPGSSTNFGATGPAGPIGASGIQGIPGVAAYRGATGATGVRGATGPIGATGLTGATGPSGLGDFYEFDVGVPSLRPDEYIRPNITGFNAYNSTDFPSPYFIGLGLHSENTDAQIAFSWNSEEEAPYGVYFRANDDTGNVRAWSAWRRILVENGLITPSAGNGPEYGIKFPNDPGGGGGDTAWIRYYAYSGEKTTLEIGVSNDGISGSTLLSTDPMFTTESIWIKENTPSAITFNTGTIGTGQLDPYYIRCNSGQDQMIRNNARYSINPANVYKLSAMLYTQTGNDRNMYLFLQFYDAAGNYVGTSSTGWGGTKSAYTYGGILPATEQWMRVGQNFGPGTTRPIPSNVTQCEIGVWFQYSGNGGVNTVVQAAQDLRLELIVGSGGPSATQDSINLVSPGGVGINKQTPAYMLDIEGDVRASKDIIAFSDARVKKDIRTIPNPLDLVDQLRGVFYNRVEDNEPGTGVIAQEVETVLPELVKTDADGFKSVAYGNFAGVLIESVKALNDRITQLEQEVKRLKGSNNDN